MIIEYYASNDTMGDTTPENCDKFRKWAQNEIQSAYPDYDVVTLDTPSLETAYTDDNDNESEIVEFCSQIWDSCPWDWMTQ